MTAARRHFTRPLGKRRYRKMFIIAAEGNKTEPAYFNLFNDEHASIHIKCLRGKHDSAPPYILARMDRYLRQQGLRKEDEAWLVVDSDQWTHKQLQQLFEWSRKKGNRGFALSNPCFEFWLLLHFEESAGIASAKTCLIRLRRHLPDYEKNVKSGVFTDQRIRDAVNRAKCLDSPPCGDWPKNTGTSTVYRLVENILGAAPDA